MKRAHTAAIAVLLGVAGVAGTVAATRTAGLGASSAQPALSERQIVQRSRQLDRFEASLRTSLAQKPPALPPVPRYTASSSTSVPASTPAPPRASTSAVSSLAAAAASEAQIVYRRPAPIVVTTPRPGGESAETEGHEDESYDAEGQAPDESRDGGDDD